MELCLNKRLFVIVYIADSVVHTAKYIKLLGLLYSNLNTCV